MLSNICKESKRFILLKYIENYCFKNRKKCLDLEVIQKALRGFLLSKFSKNRFFFLRKHFPKYHRNTANMHHEWLIRGKKIIMIFLLNKIIVKNLPASRAHSRRAQLASLESLSAPRARNFIFALRARSCALRIRLSLFLII